MAPFLWTELTPPDLQMTFFCTESFFFNDAATALSTLHNLGKWNRTLLRQALHAPPVGEWSRVHATAILLANNLRQYKDCMQIAYALIRVNTNKAWDPVLDEVEGLVAQVKRNWRAWKEKLLKGTTRAILDPAFVSFLTTLLLRLQVDERLYEMIFDLHQTRVNLNLWQYTPPAWVTAPTNYTAGEDHDDEAAPLADDSDKCDDFEDEETENQRKIAFVMGAQKRLGRQSLIAQLPLAIVDMVLERAGGGLQRRELWESIGENDDASSWASSSEDELSQESGCDSESDESRGSASDDEDESEREDDAGDYGESHAQEASDEVDDVDDVDGVDGMDRDGLHQHHLDDFDSEGSEEHDADVAQEVDLSDLSMDEEGCYYDRRTYDVREDMAYLDSFD